MFANWRAAGWKRKVDSLLAKALEMPAVEAPAPACAWMDINRQHCREEITLDEALVAINKEWSTPEARGMSADWMRLSVQKVGSWSVSYGRYLRDGAAYLVVVTNHAPPATDKDAQMRDRILLRMGFELERDFVMYLGPAEAPWLATFWSRPC